MTSCGATFNRRCRNHTGSRWGSSSSLRPWNKVMSMSSSHCNVVPGVARSDGLKAGEWDSLVHQTDMTLIHSSSIDVLIPPALTSILLQIQAVQHNSWLMLWWMNAQRHTGSGVFSHVSLIWILVRWPTLEMMYNIWWRRGWAQSVAPLRTTFPRCWCYGSGLTKKAMRNAQAVSPAVVGSSKMISRRSENSPGEEEVEMPVKMRPRLHSSCWSSEQRVTSVCFVCIADGVNDTARSMHHRTPAKRKFQIKPSAQCRGELRCLGEDSVVSFSFH